MKIKSLKAKEISNSLSEPTVEVLLETQTGAFLASVPSGVSTGKHEAAAVKASQAIDNIEKVIGPQLKSKEWKTQKQIDEFLIELDGAENKSRLGANALLAVSIACLRAGAKARNMSLYQYISEIFNFQFSIFKLPKPMMLCLEGGRHGASNLSAQEFMTAPLGSEEGSFQDNFSAAKKIYYTLKKMLADRFNKKEIKTGCEGGLVAPFKNSQQALDLLCQAIEKSGFEGKFGIALDIAASELVSRDPTFANQFAYQFEGKALSAEQLFKVYQKWLKSYPIVSLEDPFSQDDWQGWQEISSKFKVPARLASQREAGRQSSKLLIVGDDLTVTNPQKMKIAKEQGLCNAVIIKPNQIGTVTEAIEASILAKEFGWQTVVSHRAGETTDDFIADLAVGVGSDFIKAGAPKPKERMAKYNRLLEIEMYMR